MKHGNAFFIHEGEIIHLSRQGTTSQEEASQTSFALRYNALFEISGGCLENRARTKEKQGCVSKANGFPVDF